MKKTNHFANNTSIPIMIMAGGKSERLQLEGQLKWQLPFGDTDLLGYIINKARQQSPNVVINGPYNYHPLLAQYGLPIVDDHIPNTQGPLAGLLATLQWANDQHLPWIATIACDTPFFPNNLLEQFIHSLTNCQKPAAIACRQHRVQGVFGLWSSQLLEQLNHDFTDNGARSIQRWAMPHAICTDFPPADTDSQDPFFNINTLGDYQQAQAILEEISP